jgi:GNAT superfamily N-acetyltransferase
MTDGSGTSAGRAPGDTGAAPSSREIRIVSYGSARADHRTAFRDLNLAWIEEHFVVEARDRHELDDPERHILAAGGRIFMAEADGPAGIEVLGTCALLVEPDGACELAKMAVHASARGRGVGRALGESAIAAARALRAPRIELLSNTVLSPAIALYRTLGFVEVPLPATEYARANIKMTLDLSPQ